MLEFAGHLGWTWVGSKPFHAAAGSSGLGADVFLVSNAHGDRVNLAKCYMIFDAVIFRKILKGMGFQLVLRA